jgi:hypothetical protein
MATEKDPLGNDLRKAKRRRALPPNPACICGENRPEALEAHHPAGDANAPDLVIARCKNCHAADTEAQRDVGADLSHRPGRNIFEVVEAGLLSLAAFLEALARQFCEWASLIRAAIEGLDDGSPGWRQLPGVLV